MLTVAPLAVLGLSSSQLLGGVADRRGLGDGCASVRVGIGQDALGDLRWLGHDCQLPFTQSTREKQQRRCGCRLVRCTRALDG